MKRWLVVIGLLVVVTLPVWAGPLCSGGSVAADTKVVATPTGTIVVDVCVTRSGGQDTYTYRFTRLGGGAIDLCRIQISGYGVFTTTSATTLAGWGSGDRSTGCATWWVWKLSTGTPPAGHALTVSFTVDSETVPVDVPATVGNCGGEETPFLIIGPALPGADVAFTGVGPRIDLLRSGDSQSIMRCESAWLRHGFSGPSSTIDPTALSFQLLVDGVAVPLDRRVLCAPSLTEDTEATNLEWHISFPPNYFTVGTHAITGIWVWGMPEYRYDRTIELVVKRCGPALPDLSIQVDPEGCTCGWTPKQEYVCTVKARVTVTNIGDAPSPATGISASAGHSRALATVPTLAPGETYTTDIHLVNKRVHYGAEPCPLSVTVMVDFVNSIEEYEEANNKASFDVCCH